MITLSNENKYLFKKIFENTTLCEKIFLTLIFLLILSALTGFSLIIFAITKSIIAAIIAFLILFILIKNMIKDEVIRRN